MTRIVKITERSWLRDAGMKLSKLNKENVSDHVCHSTSTMAGIGYVEIGTCEITFTLMDERDSIPAQLEMIAEEERQIRIKAETALQATARKRENLLSLEMTPRSVEDDIPF